LSTSTSLTYLPIDHDTVRCYRRLHGYPCALRSRNDFVRHFELRATGLDLQIYHAWPWVLLHFEQTIMCSDGKPWNLVSRTTSLLVVSLFLRLDLSSAMKVTELLGYNDKYIVTIV
jgi:hypothetical protein